jgi:hypothetical protein
VRNIDQSAFSAAQVCVDALARTADLDGWCEFGGEERRLEDLESPGGVSADDEDHLRRGDPKHGIQVASDAGPKGRLYTDLPRGLAVNDLRQGVVATRYRVRQKNLGLRERELPVGDCFGSFARISGIPSHSIRFDPNVEAVVEHVDELGI